MKEFFEKCYLTGRKGWHSKRVLDCVKEFSKILKKGSKVLDIGCGEGKHVNFLTENGFDAYGIDYIDIKREFKGKYILADFFEYDFKFKFNAVLDNGFLHHVEDREKYLRKLKKILKKDGFYLLSCFSENDKTKNHLGRDSSGDIEHFGHYDHFFSLKEIQRLFKDFKILKVSEEINENGKAFYHVVMRRNF